MKQYCLLICLLSAITNLLCISQFSSNAVHEMHTRARATHKMILTDTQYKKEKQRQREKRHAEQAMQRERNAQERSKKLQSFYHSTDAQRTSADHAEKSRLFCREKARNRAQHKAVAAQKTTYVEAQVAAAEQKINIHAAARDALRRKL